MCVHTHASVHTGVACVYVEVTYMHIHVHMCVWRSHLCACVYTCVYGGHTCVHVCAHVYGGHTLHIHVHVFTCVLEWDHLLESHLLLSP